MVLGKSLLDKIWVSYGPFYAYVSVVKIIIKKENQKDYSFLDNSEKANFLCILR